MWGLGVFLCFVNFFMMLNFLNQNSFFAGLSSLNIFALELRFGGEIVGGEDANPEASGTLLRQN
jgi:hypothetical protein